MASAQLVFISGEPGIGKTTLVEAFLKTLLLGFGVIAAIGLCIEQFGTGEAYLPVLDLLERMCNSPGSDTIVECLRQCAPSWLASLPMIVSPAERTELVRHSLGTTPERRMRELTIFLDTVSKQQTVVLVLEDLHWIDPSTLTLISFLARRREPARLMVIGTYREAEVEGSNHPLKNIKGELQLHHHCTQLRLKLLDQHAVGEYLASRFETDAIPKPVLSTVYRRSEGNPLFMVNVTDYLLGREAIVRDNGSVKLVERSELESVPETIRDLIERQVDVLSQEDQELLETASVAGTTFSVAAIARVLNKPREEVEDYYRHLAERGHYLQYAGSRRRPDGHGSPRYTFIHVLYQHVIYDRVDAARRRRLHRVIGERTEAAYSGVTDLVAAELALHFERGGDNERAVKYTLQAAQKSFSVCAYVETIDYARRALALAVTQPHSAQRSEIELNLQLLIAVATCASKGYAAEETGHAFALAIESSRHVNDDTLLFQSLAGIWSFYLLRGELRTALNRARELLALAQQTQNQVFLLNAHMAMALSLFYQGRFQPAHEHLQQALPHYDLEYHRSTISLFGWDPGVLAYCYDAQALWFLGFPERAEVAAADAIALVKKLSSPFNEALCFAILGTYYAYRRDATRALAMAEAALKIADDRGFQHWVALGSVNKGWSLCRLGQANQGLPILLDGMKMWKDMGAEMAVPSFQGLLAEVYQTAGKIGEALAAVEEGLAIAARNNDRHYDAELHRLEGELLLKKSKRIPNNNSKEAKTCFLRAIHIPRKQRARSLELRAVMALARFWRTMGKKKEAYRLLAKIYGRFAEGIDTPDLKDAKTLLEERNDRKTSAQR